MRIGFFTDSYLPATHGVEISIESFREMLEKMGHQVFVFAPHTPGYRDKNPRVFRLESVKIIKKPEMRLALPAVHQGHLRQLIDFKLDIVHAHSPFSLGLLGKYIAQHQKIPIIYTHHTHYPEYAKAYFKEKIVLPRLAKKFSVWFSNGADAVIAPSYKIKTLLKNYGVKKPIYILPTGVNLKLFKATRKSQTAAQILRKKLGIAKSAQILLFVGRMGKEKNIDFLIKAFSKISARRQNTCLLLVGDGPELDELKTLAKNLGLESNIIFTGSVPHNKLSLYYQASDIFIFSSLTETQGIVILEAMASSLPIVALKDEALRDVAINDQNGFLIASKSIIKFSEKVLKLLNDKKLRRTFSKTSQKLAQNFSEESEAKKLLKLYQEISDSFHSMS